MKLEIFSQSKDRRGKRDGDDIAVCVPGRLYAVFDGATDALGTRVNGESVGRIAARVVADVITGIAMDTGRAADDAGLIIGAASSALRKVNAALSLPIPASTTIAAVFETETAFRVLILGDSSVRVNGAEIITRAKVIDEVSTQARVAVFRLLQVRNGDADDVELATRAAILLGLDHGVADGVLSRREADHVLQAVADAPAFRGMAGEVRAFLSAGIRRQFIYANNVGSPLGYASMNGTPTDLSAVIDRELPKATVRSLELFTDGYFGVPAETGVGAWEREFARIEAEDPHKIAGYPAVKGTTTTEFSDDRTVIALMRAAQPA